MYSIKEIFDDIVLLAKIIEENDIDWYKFPKGVEVEKIEEWEKANDAKLPQGYKEFILLANGFECGCNADIFPLEGVTLEDTYEEYKGYYYIGSYIGDGSKLLADKEGEFYCADHVFGIEKADFKTFLIDNIIDYMKDTFLECDLVLPDSLNIK